MPAVVENMIERASSATADLESIILTAEQSAIDTLHAFSKRINIPTNSTSPPDLVAAQAQDPWNKSGKYALGWVYFCLILLVAAGCRGAYLWGTDRLRIASHQDQKSMGGYPDGEYESPDSYEMNGLSTNSTVAKLFPRPEDSKRESQAQTSDFSVGLLDKAVALFRWVFYRQMPMLRWRKHTFSFPSIAVSLICFCAIAFVTLYTFLPKPLYRAKISFGSPPLAIRAGMISVAMVPWIIALSMKVNLITLMTGISHERLNVLHRYGGYICLGLGLVHAIPFYVQPVWDQGGQAAFQSLFSNNGGSVYGSGKLRLLPV
jgi:Ferric reductase like transmembrane component